MYNSMARLNKKQIGSIETAKDAPVLLMPSITICPTVMRDESEKRAENITNDFDNLPKLKEWIEEMKFHTHIIINNRYIFSTVHESTFLVENGIRIITGIRYPDYPFHYP